MNDLNIAMDLMKCFPKGRALCVRPCTDAEQ